MSPCSLDLSARELSLLTLMGLLAPPPGSSLESSVNLGGIGQSAPPAASTPPVAVNAPPAAAAPQATAPAANNAAQPDIDTSGLTLQSALSLGNLAQQTMAPSA